MHIVASFADALRDGELLIEYVIHSGFKVFERITFSDNTSLIFEQEIMLSSTQKLP